MKRSDLPGLLRAIAAFDAVARSGGFSPAAKQLGIAQSAVSRHVSRLEEVVGQALLERSGRGITLTTAGTFLASHTSGALDELSDALESLASVKGATVTVASSHDVASMWLIPRINRFRAQHPEADIRLVVGDNYASFDQGDIDISLRFGKGQWNGWQSVHLFDEEVFAVCAPSLIAKHAELRRLRSPHDLLTAPLLNIVHSRGPNWSSWLRSLGARAPASTGMHYPTYLTSLDAAVDGEGVALCWRFLSGGYLLRGQLERLGSWTVKSGESFFLLHRPSKKPVVRELINFMKSAAEQLP